MPQDDKQKPVASNVVVLHPKSRPLETASGHSTDEVLKHLLNTPPVKKPKVR